MPTRDDVHRFWRYHWKGMFSVMYPLALLALFLGSTEAPMRCFYVLLLVSGYWIFEVMPLAVSAMMPIFLFPVFSLMDSETVGDCYASNVMIFIGGVMIAIAVEYSNLHTRICLHVINKIGFSPRKLLVGVVIITAFSTIWISTTAATAWMIKIVYAVLKEMEAGGICQMWMRSPTDTSTDSFRPVVRPISGAQTLRHITLQRGARDLDEDLQSFDDGATTYDIANVYRKNTVSRRSRFLSHLGSLNVFDPNRHPDATRRPTKITMCYFLSTSFAANIAGLSTLVGSGPNKVMKGMFHAIFPSSEGIPYMKWLALTCPMMLLMLTLTTLWMQFFYLGLFRPSSEDALAISADVAAQNKAKDMIRKQIADLPPMSFHEIMVAVLSVTMTVLWLFRDPGFIPGWDVLNLQIKDDTVAMGVLVLMFVIPAKPRCFRSCSKDATKRPTETSEGLLTWDVVHRKFPWGLIFLLGGGMALAAGLKKSGTSHVIAERLDKVVANKQYVGMMILTLVSTVFTQLMSNTTVSNIFLPIIAELAVAHRVHPVYYMLPVTITCNFAFCLPASTPATAMACFACNIKTTELLKMAIPVTIICVLVLYLLFPALAPLIWTDTYPKWADDIIDEKVIYNLVVE